MEALLSRLPDEALLLALSWSGLKSCASASSASRALRAHTQIISGSPDLISRALLAEFGPNGAIHTLGSAIGRSSVRGLGCGYLSAPDAAAHMPPALRDDATLSATFGELLSLIGAGCDRDRASTTQPPAAGNVSGARQPAQRLEAPAVGSLVCAAAAAGYARVADAAVQLLLRLTADALGQAATAGQPPATPAAAAYLAAALLAASRGGHAAVVALLLRAGADPNAPAACGCGGSGCGSGGCNGTAGAASAAATRGPQLATMGTTGAAAATCCGCGCGGGRMREPTCALLLAARSGHIDVVRLLLDAGARVDGAAAAAAAGGVFAATAASAAPPSPRAFGAAALANPAGAAQLWPCMQRPCHERGMLPPAPAAPPPWSTFVGPLHPGAAVGRAASAPAAALPPLPSLLTLAALRSFPPPRAPPPRPPAASSMPPVLQWMAAAAPATAEAMPQTPAAPPAMAGEPVAAARRDGTAVRAAAADADAPISRGLPPLLPPSTLAYTGARGTGGASLRLPAPVLLSSASPPAAPPSPLLAACRAGHAETVELLLRRGAKVEGAAAAAVLLAATAAVPATASASKSAAARVNLMSRFPPGPVPAVVAAAAAAAAAEHEAASGIFAAAGAAAAAAAAASGRGGGPDSGVAAPRSLLFDSDGDDDEWANDDGGAGIIIADAVPATPDQHSCGPGDMKPRAGDGVSNAAQGAGDETALPATGALRALLAARPLELSRHLGSALVAAAASNRGAAVQALLAAGADAGGEHGAAALREAAYQGHLGVLQQLLAAGGARLAAGGGARAALQLAMQWGRGAAAEALSRHLHLHQQPAALPHEVVPQPLYI